MKTNIKIIKLNSRLPLHEWQRLELENKRLELETEAMRQENALMKRLVQRAGRLVQRAGLLSVIFSFTGCVVVQSPGPVAPPLSNTATNQAPRILRAPPMPPPMPPAPMKVVKIQPTFTARFTCLNVSLLMANKEIRDERGIGTGQWDSERRYVVTLQPIPDGTNGLVVWGANRDGMIKLVTPYDEFEQGKQYEFSSVP